MVLKRSQQTIIAISKKNHLQLSWRCRKGQSFDSILTEVLKKLKESEENKAEQSKVGSRKPNTSTVGLTSIQTISRSDSNDE